MRHIYILLLASILMGCVGVNHPSRIAVLQNPTTKQTVECRANPGGSFDYRTQIDNCIVAYKKAGYALVADSADDTQAPTPH